MAEFPAPQSASSSSTVPVTAGLVAYLLIGIAAVLDLARSGLAAPAPILSIIGIVAVVICYVKRDEAAGTWVASHLTWLIRTFWWSTIWALIGWVVLIMLAIVLIGLALGPLIWAVTAIWVLYRVIRGFLAFKDSRPIPGV